MVKVTGAQALVRVLVAESVQHVFGIVGGKLAPLLHALANEPSIRFTGLRHEASASMMAAAIQAGTGKIAVALGEMGPGGLNLAAGMGVALGNNLAMLAITTNQHRAAAYPHSGMFMDLDTRAVMAPLTKWNAVIHDPRRIPELTRRAFREALSGRPGPVHLDIPQDVLSAPCEFSDDELAILPSRYRSTLGPRPHHDLVRQAAQLLGKASRPLIVAGGGVVAAAAQALVRDLAQKLGAPVIPTQMALGVVASNSPAFIGHGGLISGDAVKQAFAQADVVISVGCRFSSWMWDEMGPLVRRLHHVININIDPSALGHPVMHDVAMQADAKFALSDLLDALQSTTICTEVQWLPSLRAVRQAYLERLAQMNDEVDGLMHPAALASAIGRSLPADALATFDGGHTTFWSNDLTPVHDVRTRLHEPGMSHLGFGLPYAMALKLVYPGRPVFNLTGDGSFGFTMNELDSARRLRLPVITLIHNNASWGIIRSGQKMQLSFELGTSLEGSDYAAIAKGFGCYGETVRQADQVAPAIERALASGLPAVIDCHTRFVPHPAMPMFGSMNRFGFDALTLGGNRT
jgi:thiamine pyrophosphate-dependent acetolactate synthase large subunit-like protein